MIFYDLSLIIIRFFVNPIDGSVKIGQIDPSTIDEIETDPDNIEKPLRFHQRPVGPSATTPGDPSPTQQGVLDTEGRWFEAGRDVAQFAIQESRKQYDPHCRR